MSNLDISANDLGQVEDVYQEAMNAGHTAAWEQDWNRAIPAYMTAIRARPHDPSAHNSLGYALLQMKRLEDALKVYQRAVKLAPDDPIPLEKSADILERLGRLEDAAKQYLAVADIYLGQKEPDVDKAIGNWERATRITSGLVEVHKRLALAYERTGRKKQAVREYLTLAANYQVAGNTQVAIQAVERALRIEPQNPQALNALQALRSGTQVLKVTGEFPAVQEAKAATSADDELSLLETSDEAANEDGPLGEAVEHALEALAVHVMESGAIMEQSGMLTIQAIELHRQEVFDNAISTYKQALKAGMRHDGVLMSLGALCIAEGSWRDAIGYLQNIRDTQFVAGAQHGLGIAYWQLNDARQAAYHLIQTFKAVEVSMASNPADVRQLSELYDSMTENFSAADEQTLSGMNERFFSLLTGAGWKRRVELTRNQLKDAIKGDQFSILDIASVPPEVIQSMHQIDRYIEARRYNLAMEEAFYVIEKEPDYLSAHLKVGEILVQLNRIESAVAKYNWIARTYLARDNRDRATEVLSEIIKAAPMDVSVRMNLIELYEEYEEWDKLLPEYIYLGDAYMNLSDTASARETYNHAIMIAKRLQAPPPVIAEIMHKVVDMEMLRLDLRSAMRTCEQIKQIHPEDRKARELLVDIHYRMGNTGPALNELDALLQFYTAQKDGKAILETLQFWVKQRPDDEAIRSRIAAIYHQIRQYNRALEHYNHLLQLQLNNGRHADACKTISTVLTLNPPHKEKYQQLGKQLGCL